MPRTTVPIRRWADALRRAFDRLAAPLGPATPVALLAALAVEVGLWRGNALRPACADQAVPLLPLELTFAARRFAALLGGLARVRAGCAPAVVRSFVTYDVLLALCYAAALCALLLWLERWRRFDPDNRPTGAPLGPARDVAVLLPIAAAACELAAERVPLWTAAQVGRAPALAGPLVVVGSLGAAAKWTLLALALGAGLAELLRGPRGVVLRRVRYSALALALGAVPLALVPQGQDVLQRLVEGEHPWVRVASALLALAFAAAAVWYCARKLVELRVAAEQPAGEPAFAGWYRYFAEQLPRLLGTAVVAAGGAAFALAGLDPVRFALWTGAGLLAAVLLERFAPAAMERAGRVLLPRRHWRDAPRFGARAASVAVTTLVAALGVWPSDRSLPDAVRVLRAAAWLAAGTAGAFYLLVSFRRARRAARETAPETAPDQYAARLDALRGRAVDAVHPAEARPQLQLGVLAAAVASFVALALFTYAPVPVARWVGPVWVLAVAVSNAVFIGSLTVWAGYRYRVRVVPWALGLAVLFSVWNDNHLVRTVPSAAVAARPGLRAYVRGWLGRAPADTGPVALVAASGGGLRAAYWAAVTLATVQDSDPEFAGRVLAVSGVSGGSLGAAVFAAFVRDGGARALPCAADTLEPLHTAAPRGPLATCVRRFMRDDFLSPVLAKLVAPDAAQNFVPWPVFPADRSTALEGSWARSYEAAAGRRTLDTAFLAFAGAPPGGAPNDQPNATPALVLNATHVETGRRYVAAPFRVPVGDGADAFGAAGDLLGALGADLPLAAAVHNSARFPYVSPAGRLERDGESLGRVVDGGYFENSGLATLQDVYAALRLELDALGRRRPVLVVYLCNDPTTCEGSVDRPAAASDGRADADSASGADAAPRVGRGAASELLAPVRTLLNARDARGELARARLRALVGDGQFLELDVCAGLPRRAVPTDSGTARLARERVVSPPLGWLLSRVAREWMDGSLVSDAPVTAAPGPTTCRARNAAVVARLAALRGGAR